MAELVKRQGLIPDLCHRLLSGDWSAAVPLTDALTEAGRDEDARELASLLLSYAASVSDNGSQHAGHSGLSEFMVHFAADLYAVESLASECEDAERRMTEFRNRPSRWLREMDASIFRAATAGAEVSPGDAVAWNGSGEVVPANLYHEAMQAAEEFRRNHPEDSARG